MKLPTATEMLFGIKCFVAAMLALYIALKMGLPRSSWAPMTTCAIAQTMTGG